VNLTVQNLGTDPATGVLPFYRRSQRPHHPAAVGPGVPVDNNVFDEYSDTLLGTYPILDLAPLAAGATATGSISFAAAARRGAATSSSG